MKPTKKFLLEQIEACKLAIYQNQGALNLCQKMIENGCFIEEEVKQEVEENKDVKI